MKKLLTLIVFLISLFVLSGCNNGSHLVEINADEIFTQEGNYYIFFYEEDSEDSDSVKPVVEAYMDAVTKEEKYQSKSKVYAVNLSNEENKAILRTYNGELGQGDAGDFYVNGVTKWEDLYIASTSALISIKTNSENLTYAEFEAQTATNIYTFLGSYLDN